MKKKKIMMLAMTAVLSAAGLWGCRGATAYLTGEGQETTSGEPETAGTSAAGGVSDAETSAAETAAPSASEDSAPAAAGTAETAEIAEAAETAESPEFTVIQGITDTSAPEGMALAETLPFFQGDQEWKLEYYVQEDMLADGELALDDLCRFQIRAVSSDSAYVLFDDQVQLGVPAADVWTDEENRLHIVIRDTRTALYRITDFVYEEERDVFCGQETVNQEGINYWGTLSGQ